MKLSATTIAAATVLVTAVACGGSSVSDATDGGASGDGGVALDASVSDAGSVRDATGSNDANSGGDAGSMSDGAASDGSSDGGGCSSAPSPAVRTVSLSLTGADFGDSAPTAWKQIGVNVDGKCTTAASTDVCALTMGAAKAVQVDGFGGIDNSFGANICALFDSTSGSGACSSKLQSVDIATDATGKGTLAMTMSGGTVMQLAVDDVYVVMNGNGGVIGGVIPTESAVTAMNNMAGCFTQSLCSGTTLQSVDAQIRQASDIFADGTNTAAGSCDAISFGVRFTGSSPFNGVFPPVKNCCADGG